MNISLDEKESYVLTRIFQDAMKKIGKKKLLKSMSYDIDNGLVITDENDVSWTLQINAEIKVPEELRNKQNARTSDTTCIFCCECDAAIKGYSEDIKPICSTCEYIDKS
jgi:hypothetical protein